ncbi:MAG: sugar-transfer associated ATP-grasp domain-containing protein [Pseudomonadota bacterium]
MGGPLRTCRAMLRAYRFRGYQGVDIVLDKGKGPLILKLNARPGLNIQIATRVGLLPRLRQAEHHRKSLGSIEERVAFAREQFCALKA